MAYGWHGDKVRLVPLDKERHLENAVTWLNDPELTRYLLHGDFPLSRLAEEKYFDADPGDPPRFVHFAVETLGDEPEHIGFAGIEDISWHHRSATTGTVIGRQDLWGRGYGSDLIRTRTRYAFDVLGLRLLTTLVMAENVGSLKALMRSGYREAGRIPGRYWKRGRYRDAILLYVENP